MRAAEDDDATGTTVNDINNIPENTPVELTHAVNGGGYDGVDPIARRGVDGQGQRQGCKLS